LPDELENRGIQSESLPFILGDLEYSRSPRMKIRWNLYFFPFFELFPFGVTLMPFLLVEIVTFFVAIITMIISFLFASWHDIF